MLTIQWILSTVLIVISLTIQWLLNADYSVNSLNSIYCPLSAACDFGQEGWWSGFNLLDLCFYTFYIYMLVYVFTFVYICINILYISTYIPAYIDSTRVWAAWLAIMFHSALLVHTTQMRYTISERFNFIIIRIIFAKVMHTNIIVERRYHWWKKI